MAKDITQTVTFDATPAVVYRALVDAKQHALMTGSRATNDGKVGGTFSAYDAYIVGFNIELSKGERIVQAWRAKRLEGRSVVHRALRIEASGHGRNALGLHSSRSARLTSQGHQPRLEGLLLDAARRVVERAREEVR